MHLQPTYAYALVSRDKKLRWQSLNGIMSIAKIYDDLAAAGRAAKNLPGSIVVPVLIQEVIHKPDKK